MSLQQIRQTQTGCVDCWHTDCWGWPRSWHEGWRSYSTGALDFIRAAYNGRPLKTNGSGFKITGLQTLDCWSQQGPPKNKMPSLFWASLSRTLYSNPLFSFHCFSFAFPTCSGLCVYFVVLLSLISLHTHLIDLTHYTASHSFSHTGLLHNSWHASGGTTPSRTSVNFTFSPCVFVWGGVCVKHHRAREGV